MRLNPISTTVPTTDVEFLASRKNLVTLGVTLDADLVRTGQYTASVKILKAGTVLGKVTSTGLYGPVKKTTIKTTASAAQKDVAVTDASFFQVGDSVTIGTETAQAIAAINYTTNTLTMTDNLAGDQGAGRTVAVATGEETAAAILLNTIDLTNGDAAVAAITQGVVLSARLKGYNTLVAADLTRVEFR